MISSSKHRLQGRFPFRFLHAQEILSPGTQKFVRENYSVLTVEYVSDGAGFLEINGKSFHIFRDSVYFLTPGSSHAYWPDRNDPWSKIFFVVYGDLVDFLLKAYALDEIYCIPDAPELKKYFREMLYLKHGKENDSRASVVFHRFLDEVHRHLAQKSAPQIPPHMENLRKKLDDSLGRRFSVSLYAEEHACSESALIRSFRRTFGITPHEYLIENKIAEAENYLLYTALSIKEIAAALAFSDQYHFSNAFKSRKGCSPSDFRKRGKSLRRGTSGEQPPSPPPDSL
ncbi:MAG: helix-turn-helix transcriptional regulator [Lentisphaeria bacterium]|nr:helix-turn-helix transcriptional regulator [Lentisphaeria bacterium]